MHRRRFLKTSSAAASSLVFARGGRLVAAPAASDYIGRIGLQLYTLRGEIGKDAVATIKAVAGMGYHQAELYGFPKAGTMLAAAKDAGLEVHSSHFEWDSVVKPKDEAMSDFARILDQAKEAGLSHLVIPFLHGDTRGTLDDYRKVADHCNKAAAMAREAGIQLAYHNHSFEFEPKADGKSGFDVFIERFSPEMMFELDVFWVKVAAIDPVDLIRRLKGRVSQLHLKDLKEGVPMPNYAGGLPADAFKELGNGIIPMKPILEAAADCGVVHCHVEQDQSPDALKSVKVSLDHLRKL